MMEFEIFSIDNYCTFSTVISTLVKGDVDIAEELDLQGMAVTHCAARS